MSLLNKTAQPAVKVIREALVLEVLDRTLDRKHVPVHHSVFFNGTDSASSRSRMPAQDAEACLLEQTLALPVRDGICVDPPLCRGTSQGKCGSSTTALVCVGETVGKIRRDR